MEVKQISYDVKSANYNSFIAENLDSYNQCGIKGGRIRACFHGWVILSNHPDNVLWSLWNPLTSKLISLPPLVRKQRASYGCCLSSPPDDQGSVFMLLPDNTRTIVFCLLDNKRKRLKWTEMSYAKQLMCVSGVDDCFLRCPTCCDGKVYAMALGCHYRFVIHADIVVKGKDVVIRLLPIVKVPNISPFSFHNVYSFLKGCCTNLIYIEVHFKDDARIVETRLFKFDMTCMMWEEMEDLKDDVFFVELSSCSVFHKSTVTSQIRGCIHVLGGMGGVISFHVKDRTMSLSPMPCTVRENQVLVWAMLECRFEAARPKAKQGRDTEIAIRSVNCDETGFDSATSESRLLDIPFDVLELIREHCYGVEFKNFRATCKRFYLAAPLKRPRMHSPWLLVIRNYEGVFSFVDPMCGDEYVSKIPRELNGHCNILCSRYGWLLLLLFKTHGCELVFCNPFTGKIRKLPTMPCFFGSYCFSAPPTSPECMVVGFTTHGPYHVFVHFISQEPPSWRGYRLNFGTNDPYSFRFPIFSGQNIYALCKNDERIDVIRDMSEKGYSREAVVDKAPGSYCKSKTKYFLSKCDEHILLVIVGGEIGESVEVFKLNDSTKGWEKIYDLGKHMIYISDTSCICLEAKSLQMANKIYFPRYHGNTPKVKSPQMGSNIYSPRLLHNTNTQMVYYSLETCNYHTFNDKNIQKGVLFSCDPHTWIE